MIVLYGYGLARSVVEPAPFLARRHKKGTSYTIGAVCTAAIM